MSAIAIHIENLSKQYKGVDFPALQDFCLTVQEGEIFGLLGPNGAGKTTLLSILCGLIKPTSGTFRINGYTYEQSTTALKQSLGVVPQDFALYPSLTARENLLYFGSMYGLKRRALEQEVAVALEALGLATFMDKRVETFSGGMKRRVNLLAGVLHRPKVLFLDEPTVGVDVHSKNAIMEYLRALHFQGTTIIYTSHHLSEAQTFCTRVGIMESGRLWKEGTPEQLIAEEETAQTLEDVFIEITGRGLRDG